MAGGAFLEELGFWAARAMTLELYLFLTKYSAQKCKTGFTDDLLSPLPGHAQGAKRLSTLGNLQLNKQFCLCLCQVFGDS